MLSLGHNTLLTSKFGNPVSRVWSLFRTIKGLTHFATSRSSHNRVTSFATFNLFIYLSLGRWEMPRERIAELKGDAIALVYYEHEDYLLATLWRGTSHVIIPGYPLLHVAPSNKVASSPRRGLIPTLKPQESSQDLREGDPCSNPTKGHKLTAKVNSSEQPRLAHTKM